MITPELRKYIDEQLAQGRAAEDIRAALLANGWQSVDVEEALPSESNPALQQESQTLPRQSTHSHRGIIFLLVSCLVVLGGVGAYAAFTSLKKPADTVATTAPSALSPNPSPTSSLAATASTDLTPFDNTQYGYSFKYPSTWTLATHGNGAKLVSPETQKTAFYGNGYVDFSITEAPYATNGFVSDIPGATVTNNSGSSAKTHDQQIKDFMASVSGGTTTPSITLAGHSGYSTVKTIDGGSIFYVGLIADSYMVIIQALNANSLDTLNTGQKAVFNSLAIAH